MANLIRRIYSGNIPADGALMERTDEWDLYVRSVDTGWVNAKLVSREPRMFKANFHLGYNRKSKGFASNTCAKVLKTELPNVYRWVLAAMQGKYPAEG